MEYATDRAANPDADAAASKLRVLNLEDSEIDSQLIGWALEAEWDKVELLRVDTREAFVRALDEFAPDVVLCDFKLPDFDGGAALAIVRHAHPEIPVIMVTGALPDSDAVKLIKMGARDYVTKDRLQRLASTVQSALSLERGIRERKAAEQALRQSDADLRSLVEHSPIAMIVDTGTGADEKIVMMNRKFTELFGYTMEDVPDIQHWWRLAYPDEEYREQLRTIWIAQAGKAVREHGDIPPKEVTVACKDGSRRHVRISLSSIKDRSIVAFEDLTERKAAEDELERFFNLIPDPVCIASTDGRFLRINPAWQELLGYTTQEILDTPFFELIHPDDRDATMKEVERQINGDATLHFCNRYRRKDGGYIWLEWKTTPAVDGKLLFASARDITARKQMEDALKEVMERDRAIMETANDAIICMKPDGAIEVWNRKAEGMFGYAAAEAVGHDLHELIVPDRYREKALEGLRQFATTGAGPVVGKMLEMTAWRKDRSEFPIELSISPINIRGEWYATGIIRDITERKQHEAQQESEYRRVAEINAQLTEVNRQLKLAQDLLLHSEKMASIGVLAAGVAHEINNPVGYINSNLGTLEKYLADIFAVLEKYEEAASSCAQPELLEVQRLKEKFDFEFLRGDVKSLLAESREGLERIKEIVLGLKDFSRSGTDEAWQWADLSKCLESTLAIVWNELKYKCEVVKEFGALPQIYCLPSQLEQVFMNLLVNAVQAIEAHGTVTIRTGREQDRDFVWVEISDTGSGIPPDVLPHIFDPFFTTKPVGSGTGLGLPVSYGIVERHHGRIDVRSEAGKGTTFRVVLPVLPHIDKEEA